MGQSLGSANPIQSKDELLFKLVLAGNVEGAGALYRHGANLECTDKEGNTPLIVACKDSALYNVAKGLIELGANINAYGPGRRGGTPVHHAASRGLEQTVRLLLFSGGNALLRNDDGQTALDIARTNRQTVVVRAIEHHICLFSGWLREFYGPRFLKSFSLQLLSRKVWAVVLPYSTSDPTDVRLQFAIYSNQQEPKFDQPDPGMTIFDPSSNSRHQLASSEQGDKDQLRWLYDACRRNSITQVGPTPRHQHMEHHIPDNGYENPEEAIQLAMALSASIQSAIEDRQQQSSSHSHGSGAVGTNNWGDTARVESHNGWGASVGSPHSEANSSGQIPERPAKENYNGWDVPSTWPASSQAHSQMHHNSLPVDQSATVVSTTSAPSAPLVPVGTNNWGDTARVESHNGWGASVGSPHSEANSSGQIPERPAKENYNGWDVPSTWPASSQAHSQMHHNSLPVDQSATVVSTTSAPSAPLVPVEAAMDEGGPIHHPSIDLGPVDFSVPATKQGVSSASSTSMDEGSASSSSSSSSSVCIICWDAPVQDACVPCGHMAGCMECLSAVKAKKANCPVCRAKITQVIKLYAV